LCHKAVAGQLAGHIASRDGWDRSFRVASERRSGISAVTGHIARAFPLPQLRRNWATTKGDWDKHLNDSRVSSSRRFILASGSNGA